MADKRTILVVEDHLINREILIGILLDKYEVLEAENGEEALEILNRDKGAVSLILLDLIMPVMDGFAFLDKIKEDKELSLIPIIVTTQSTGEAAEIAALSHGATDFIPKPYRPEVVLHRIANLIKLRETAAVVNRLKYDKLTGLYNKEYFYEKVVKELAKNPDREYIIVCSNIENFKLYNDTYGTQMGDRLLRQIAEITKKAVGTTGFCSRFSADRFFCLQKKEEERWDIESFNKSVQENTPPDMRHIVMRRGIYEITDRTLPVEQMCDRARLAASSIKGKYNRLFAVYEESMRSKLIFEKKITDSVESAILNDNFEVYLQPKYSLADKRMVGAEALVRWNHPELGLLAPGQFVPLFEKNGFITRLDVHIWEKVCRLLHDWKEKGYLMIPVSVNVSMADVYRVSLSETVSELVKKYDVDPSYLRVEITESAYAEHPEQIIDTINKLRLMGFAVEMDDFGSGYSSLTMLGQINADALKLDMNFIHSEMKKPSHKSLIPDVINMAHRMHLSVVAEGVETREQMQRLQAVGCDIVQGNLFSKPLPVKEFEELYKSRTVRENTEANGTQRKFEEASKLLVIDEDGDFREKVNKAFSRQYSVCEADNAESALATVKKLGSEGLCAVILSVALPENGADTVMKALRQDPAFWEVPVLAVLNCGDDSEKYPQTAQADDFLCKQHPMFDLVKRIRSLIELAQAHKRENCLRNEAWCDHLTGLYNRRGFFTAFGALKTEDLPLAVYVYDLDDLKKTNDSGGHVTGDRLISSFSELLRRNTGDDDILCRYGGDEFVAVKKHVSDRKTALEKGKELCRLFSERCGGASCSGGVAFCHDADNISEKLVEYADKALCRAKRESKGSCFLWDELSVNSFD